VVRGDTHLDLLRATAEAARTAGDSLIHRDVRAANSSTTMGGSCWSTWGSAAVGDRWPDHHLWLVALHAEGGPAPEAHEGPYALGHAALIAGSQPLLTPARDSNPALFGLRRRLLGSALSWTARLLHIPPPAPT
jgi:hypothetical protein